MRAQATLVLCRAEGANATGPCRVWDESSGLLEEREGESAPPAASSDCLLAANEQQQRDSLRRAGLRYSCRGRGAGVGRLGGRRICCCCYRYRAALRQGCWSWCWREGWGWGWPLAAGCAREPWRSRTRSWFAVDINPHHCSSHYWDQPLAAVIWNRPDVVVDSLYASQGPASVCAAVPSALCPLPSRRGTRHHPRYGCGSIIYVGLVAASPLDTTMHARCPAVWLVDGACLSCESPR